MTGVWILICILVMTACQPIISPTETPATIDISTNPQEAIHTVPEIAKQPVPNHIIITLSETISPETIAQSLEEQGISVDNIGFIDGTSAIIVQTTLANTPESIEKVNLAIPNAIVEPDYYAFAQAIQSIEDPLYSQQWAFPAMQLFPNTYAQLPEIPIRIALIDSGICDHPDINSQIEWDLAWDYVENDTMPQDEFSHGCPIAHLMVAQSNTLGILGIAPYARIIPYRVLNGQGIGKYSDIASAIIRATDNEAQIINLSLGGIQSSTLVINAIEYALQNGVVVIASAGNGGIEQALFPANYPPVIAIGSIDKTGIKSGFSNFGIQVDYYAPGSELITSDKNGLYWLYEGTSFSAGYASALLAVEYSFGKTSFTFDNANRLQFSSNYTITPTDIYPPPLTMIIVDTPMLPTTEPIIEIPTNTPVSTQTLLVLPTEISPMPNTPIPTPIIISIPTDTYTITPLPTYYCIDKIDTVISIEDIMQIALYYGQIVTNNPDFLVYDIHLDGVINIYDIQTYANSLGLACKGR